MTALVFPEGLAGPAVRLRPLHESDAGAYAAAHGADPDLARLRGMAFDPDEVWAREQAGRSRAAAEKGEWIELAVCDAASGAFLGAVLLLDIRRQLGCCELGYWLIPQARGKGLAHAAIALVLDWAFGSSACCALSSQRPSRTGHRKPSLAGTGSSERRSSASATSSAEGALT